MLSFLKDTTGPGWARFALLVLSGSWAAWNGVRYVLDPSLRHRGEAAWFIFAGVLLIAGLVANLRTRRVVEGAPGAQLPGGRALAIFCLLALGLYSPIVFIGLLSDDFVLLQRARTGLWIDPAWDFIRPLPLALWWAIDRVLPAGSVPVGLHCLNITVHGFNAWLVSRIAMRLGLTRRDATIAAVFFLCWPFSVEPVSWASGVFDVLMTAWILLLADHTLGGQRSLVASVGIALALTVAALACKETAVAIPLLLAALLPFVPVRARRDAAAVTGICGLVVAAYVLWRVTRGIPADQLTLSGYMTKELLSRPFGVLGMGMHAQVIQNVPAAAIALAVLWPFLFVRAALAWPDRPAGFRLVALGGAWVLCSILPLLTMLFVGPDLQGSRYLYLGSTIWSIAVAMLASPWGSSPPDRRGLAIVMVIITISVGSVFAHQRPWRHAAAAVEPVLTAIQSLDLSCTPVAATGLPDSVDGAYAFRNGFAEAVELTRGATNPESEPCTVHWDGKTLTRLAP